MGFKQQVAQLTSAIAFAKQIAYREEIPERLAHLLAFHQQMRAVHPVFYKGTTLWLQRRSFTLRDFVLVVRKHEVLAAHVHVEARSEYFHAHGAALDVPPGPPF